MKVVITAGGTGGHIFPALAVIDKIKKKEPNTEFLYIGTNDRMEKDIIPSYQIPYLGVDMMGLNRHNPFKNIKVLNTYIKACHKVKKALLDFKPDVVIGFGGYITAPVIYTASKLNIKTIIHEQNGIPGVSNKFLSRYADLVLVSFKESIKYFSKANVIYTGNPRGEQIKEVKKIKKETLGFKSNQPLIIIVMGSLGSMTMTNKLKEIIPSFKNKSYQVLLITGKNYYEEYHDVKIPNNVKLLPFYKDLIAIMKDATLMVTRSGASTIAELTSVLLPSIMVPSPYVTNNHQYVNAKALTDDNGAVMLLEKDFSKETLIPLIDSLINNEQKLKEMKNALKARKVDDSATKIYEEIKKIVRDE